MLLVLVFFFMAGLFVLLQAFFLAAVQVLVYAGAVMVLFLFVIMLMNPKLEEKRKIGWWGVVGASGVGGGLLVEFAYLIRLSGAGQILPKGNLEGSTEAVGRLLFSQYLLPFEFASILLLAAMVGVIILCRKGDVS